MEIIFNNVSLNFSHKIIFSSLNLKLTSGKIIQIIGENGSGKSTFLNLAAHLIRPTSGKIIAFCDEKKLQGEDYRKKIAMLTPDMKVYENLTAEENLKFFVGLRGKILSRDDTLNLWERVGLKEDDIKGKYAGKLSTGMSQRLKFAVFLAMDAKVWLLDEPTANLDEAGRETVIREARQAAKKDILVLWATNDERERSAADEVINLSSDPIRIS